MRPTPTPAKQTPDPKTTPQSSQSQDIDDKEHGEGNYKATRQYLGGLKEHIEHHDIEAEARAAAPRTPEEAKELEEAERIARSRAKAKDDDFPL
jgi:hypothetical protein